MKKCCKAGSCHCVKAAIMKATLRIVCIIVQHRLVKPTWKTPFAFPTVHTQFWFCFGLILWFGLAYFLSFPKHIFKADHELSAKSHCGHSGGLAAIRRHTSQTTKPGPVLRLYSVEVAHRHTAQRETWPLACANLAKPILQPGKGQGMQHAVRGRGACFPESPPQRTWGILCRFSQESSFSVLISVLYG